MRLQGRSSKACLVKCLVYRHFKKELLLDLGWNGGFAAKSGQSSKSPKCMRLTISVIHLGSVLDTVKVLKSIYPFAKRLSKSSSRKDQALPPLRGGPLPLEPRAASLFSLLDFSFMSGHRLHSRGKCRVFLRFWCTFTPGLPGYLLHRPLSPHLPSSPPGKVP